jgi:hypothetical protein
MLILLPPAAQSSKMLLALTRTVVLDVGAHGVIYVRVNAVYLFRNGFCPSITEGLSLP